MKRILSVLLFVLPSIAVCQWIDPAPSGGNIYYNGGNVGIGTTNPTVKLEVTGGDISTARSGGGALQLRTDGNGTSFISNKDNFVGNGSLGNQYLIMVGNDGIAFRTGADGNSGTERMKIVDSNGFIGIGTGNPAHKFHVVTGSNEDRSIGFSNADNYLSARSSLFYTASGNGTGIFQNAGNLLIQPRTTVARGIFFNTSNGSSVGTRLAIMSDGKIGIGTSDPNAKLDVNGNIRSMTGSFSALNPNNANAVVSLSWLNDVARLRIGGSGDGAGNGFDIQAPGNLSLLRVRGDGKVGIGTPNPDAKLTVNGDIHAKEVKVDLSIPGPDYVFEADYDLQTLESIQRFIQENKHLPEVPSAKEMKDKGIDLGVMNMLLLKKVEELTLHLIEQNEALNAQNELNAELLNRISVMEQKLKKKK